MFIPTPIQMMEAHISLNLGVFFNKITSRNSLNVATSQRISDFYWNYAYTNDGRAIDEAALNEANAALRALRREPAVWQLAAEDVPPDWVVRSEEAWMWIDAAEWQLCLSSGSPTPLSVVEERRPSEAMLHVFNDAYSTGGDAGDVGYFQLPPEYGIADANSEIVTPAIMRHFAGWFNGRCVAVATAAVSQEIGGIYSVATIHGYRRRGFGIDISRCAAAWAFANGARGVLLQTEADSPVEAMYSQLGFRRSHVGCLITPLASQG